MNREDILVICGTQIERMAYELCVKADLARQIRSSSSAGDPKIALKPNLLGPIPASEGATTHPEIVRGVIGYLRENGFFDLVVMESSWVGDRTSDSLLVTGFGDLCTELKVPFVDLQKDAGVWVDCAGMKLNLCKRALEVDFMINLPVLKGHCQTRMTCALKNMKGCIPASEKRRFHRMGLHEPIGHLAAGIRQDFIIADAICPDLTFEDGGNPVSLDRLICARDPVLMDAYGADLIGVGAGRVGYIGIASSCGAGSADVKNACVKAFLEKKEGDSMVYVEGTAPDPILEGDYRRIVRLQEMVNEEDSCSACYGSLIPALHRLEEEGLLEKLPGRLCIGQGFRGKEGKLGVGTCTSGFERTLGGCPPSQDEMYCFLKELISC